MIHRPPHKQGFTLVETLVALTILSVAIVPAYALSTSSVDIAFSIRNNMTAANLAQEGVEVVRAMRDANWFNSLPFDTGLTGCASGCRIQWDSTAVIPIGSNPVLSINSTTGVYFYPGVGLGVPSSIFRRVITITPDISIPSKKIKIESDVTWTERGRSKSVKVESHLFNWK